jgi:septal ring factor EnvC (AmiA/AmiB activator)
VVVIFISSYYFHDFIQNRNSGKNLAADETVTKEQEQYRDLIEAEVYYTSMIESKKEEIFTLAASQPLLRDEINNELVELDEDFRNLKEDLNDNADNEEVIAAMIQNYRLKLRILEETLEHLQQSNNEKSTKNEDIKVLL